jgi:transcriptional regulator of acetoin/glycerol metabolism
MRSVPLKSDIVSRASPESESIKTAWRNVVLNFKPPGRSVRKMVLKSWLRCRELGLDPMGQNAPHVIPTKALTKLRQLNRDLIEVAKPVMKMIEISVRGTGFIVTLAEKTGHVLEVRGDKDVLALAMKNFYVPGCQRSTEHAGTNGIGLCLEEGSSIQLTGAEHYNINHHPWTCSSAPIRNRKGELIGAITLSGRSIGRHKHTLALITAAANNIESQLRERALIERSHRLNSMLNSIYNSISDGFIAVDNNQEITHFNRAACKMLCLEADAVLGKRFDEVAKPDDRLMGALRTGEYFEASEISFECLDGIRTYMCRVDPIQTASFKLLGMIITMAEKRQMITIAKKIGGNYSKYEFSDIKGNNAQFRKQIEMAKIAAQSNSRILIIGESGTGKELFAQAVHSHSNRHNGPFVAVSCAAIPRDLIESELFGYKGGAFTGARQSGMMGKFELANNGTLFLDEINGLPLELQAKLLRVLQQNEIMRLGDTRTIPVDVRIIAASNTDLMEEVEKGDFREDLYYRLNVMEIVIPPLRDRIEDIGLLVHHILDRQCQEMGITKPKISPTVMKILKARTWPGNVRELENVVERALLLSQGGTISKSHLPMRARKKAGEIKTPSKTFQQGFKEMIEASLDECGGNASMAARKLKIARSTLYRKMAEFGISHR